MAKVLQRLLLRLVRPESGPGRQLPVETARTPQAAFSAGDAKLPLWEAVRAAPESPQTLGDGQSLSGVSPQLRSRGGYPGGGLPAGRRLLLDTPLLLGGPEDLRALLRLVKPHPVLLRVHRLLVGIRQRKANGAWCDVYQITCFMLTKSQ